MKILMIGTPTCTKCKKIIPQIEEYCKSTSIDYEYKLIGNTSPSEMELIISRGVKSAPVFVLYREEDDIKVITGEDIFSELNIN